MSLSSQKFGLGIQDLGYGKNISQILDPRVKKAPVPRSGSATLQLTLEMVRAPQTTAHRYPCSTIPSCLGRKPLSSFSLFRCTVQCTVVVQVALLVFCQFLENGMSSSLPYILYSTNTVLQTSIVDPDLNGSAFIWLFWIRIRIGNADPDPGAWKLTNIYK